jgi:hypothetical protein
MIDTTLLRTRTRQAHVYAFRIPADRLPPGALANQKSARSRENQGPATLCLDESTSQASAPVRAVPSQRSATCSASGEGPRSRTYPGCPRSGNTTDGRLGACPLVVLCLTGGHADRRSVAEGLAGLGRLSDYAVILALRSVPMLDGSEGAVVGCQRLSRLS